MEEVKLQKEIKQLAKQVWCDLTQLWQPHSVDVLVSAEPNRVGENVGESIGALKKNEGANAHWKGTAEFRFDAASGKFRYPVVHTLAPRFLQARCYCSYHQDCGMHSKEHSSNGCNELVSSVSFVINQPYQRTICLSSAVSVPQTMEAMRKMAMEMEKVPCSVLESALHVARC